MATNVSSPNPDAVRIAQYSVQLSNNGCVEVSKAIVNYAVGIEQSAREGDEVAQASLRTLADETKYLLYGDDEEPTPQINREITAAEI